MRAGGKVRLGWVRGFGYQVEQGINCKQGAA